MSTAAVEPTIPPPEVVHRDFPGWLPPMLVKELRQGLRTRGFVGALVIFQVIMLILMLGALTSQNAPYIGARVTGAAATTGFFWTLILVQLIVVTPARALGGLQLEVESRTLDLLMLTRLNAWGVVLGKWISLLAQAMLLLVAMLPYLVVRYFTDNADILTDFGRCLGLLGVSAVLTAAGLWGSGVAKILRIVIVVVIVWGSLGAAGAFGSRFFGMRPITSSGSPFFSLFDSPFDIVNAGLITAYFLVSAVRNVAPPAENHGFFARILPLLAMLPAPFAELIGAHDMAVRQLMFAGLFLAFVLLFELGSARMPMASQWREWRRRGPLLATAGAGSLPGWQSAYAFGVVAGLCWAVFALIVLPDGKVATRDYAEHVAWLALLAFSGLVFPAVVRSFIPVFTGPPLLFFCCILVIPALMSGLGLWLAESRWKFTLLKSVMMTMPGSSFLFALNPPPTPDPLTTALAGAVAILVLGLAAWQSRPYWHQLTLFEARDRAARQPST